MVGGLIPKSLEPWQKYGEVYPNLSILLPPKVLNNADTLIGKGE